MDSALYHTNCPDLRLVARGKVRDLYHVDDESYLFVATDRISAFDVSMKNAIPGRGRIITAMSLFWFDFLREIIPNHLITANIDEMPAVVQKYRDQLQGRAMLVKKLRMLPIEAIVRGNIAGSGWKEYTERGTICSIQMPPGLKESEEFKVPLFTPSTKAEHGTHDENIHPDEVVDIIGREYADMVAKESVELFADMVAKKSVELFQKARSYAMERGIIIADTKFEFGVDRSGRLLLADEVLTPDSSRFWELSEFTVGQPQKSLDKQYLRDYLISINFDRKTPVELPIDVVKRILQKYRDAYQRLVGKAPAVESM